MCEREYIAAFSYLHPLPQGIRNTHRYIYTLLGKHVPTTPLLHVVQLQLTIDILIQLDTRNVAQKTTAVTNRHGENSI